MQIAFGDVNFGVNLLFMPGPVVLSTFATEPTAGIDLMGGQMTPTFRNQFSSKIFYFIIFFVLHSK